MRDKALEVMENYAISFHPTGSRYICHPPPMDTDEDYICLGNYVLMDALRDLGAKQDGDEEYDIDIFLSFRIGDLNLIVTESLPFYKAFVRATVKAKDMNLLDKQDRINLFQEELYGSSDLSF